MCLFVLCAPNQATLLSFTLMSKMPLIVVNNHTYSSMSSLLSTKVHIWKTASKPEALNTKYNLPCCCLVKEQNSEPLTTLSFSNESLYSFYKISIRYRNQFTVVTLLFLF